MQLHWVLVLLSSSTGVFGAPSAPRIFGNKNALRITPTPDRNMPEEELELESLKGHKSLKELGHLELDGNGIDNPTPTDTSTTVASTTYYPANSNTNGKRPENEEMPALSDNANSLKFPHHNPGGLNEALLHKKSHNGQPHSQQMNLGDELLNAIDSGPLGKDDHLNFQLDYTPQDIAEYIFWTGDDRGVAAAIGDFLQDGVVGREDAVRFLEDVKRELNSIRSRYSASLAQGQQAFPHNFSPVMESFKGYTGGSGIRSAKRESYFPPEITNSLPLSSNLDYMHGMGGQAQHEANALPLSPAGNLLSVEELDYDEIAERLRSADAKMREYALEDVIYQIGKNLFAESLKNSPGESTQKFSEFVEAQNANGRIPKDLEKDVLEVLVGAFVDAVDEQNQQHEGHHGPKSDGQIHLHQPGQLKKAPGTMKKVS